MEWLGLEYDEGPFYQSRRYDLYREAADRLIREGKAYRAFETPEELDARAQGGRGLGARLPLLGRGSEHPAGGE